MDNIAFLSKSPKEGKKYRIEIGHKKIDFGAAGYADYTTHKDGKRKSAYIRRHAVNEKWNDPHTAGFWSRWLLWNKPTLTQSAEDIRKKFGIKILKA